MAVDYNEVYILDPEFEIQQKDNQVLYVDWSNVNWIRMDKSGSELLALCDGTLSLDEVLDKLSSQYGFTPEFMKSHLSTFVENVVNKGVLLKKGETKKYLQNVYPDHPNDIWIHLTEQCNLACPFCYSSSGMNGKNTLKADNILSFLKQVPEIHRKGIILSGGEPFLYPELDYFCERINEMGYTRITIITNGTVGEELYKSVIPRIHTLQISVDGTTAHYHDYTRSSGSFEKVIPKFKLAREYGVKHLIISFTPNKFNIENLPSLPDFALTHLIDGIHITRLQPAGRGVANREKLLVSDDIFYKYIREFIVNFEKVNRVITYIRENEQRYLDESEKRKHLGVTFAGDLSERLLTRGRNYNCGLGCAMISINFDGYVYPCPQMHFDCFRLGHIQKDLAPEVFAKGVEFVKRTSVDNETSGCHDCKYRLFCAGGCRAAAHTLNGDVMAKDPRCQYYIDFLEELMWKANYNVKGA
ncbi:MAG: PqqD family peptide modification chaperone [Firmicutes bacterium]|nr:PqqD family peptide modification chaperone [Bacillota bacterium]